MRIHGDQKIPVVALGNPVECSHFKLRQLMRRVSQHYDLELCRVGLKTTQYSLLSHVARLGPVRPGDLARAMSLDASTLTRNLKPLVAAGWIAVGAGSDARSRQIAITPAGLAKRAAAQPRWRAAQDALDELLGMGEVRALHALVDRSLDRFAAVEATGRE